MEEYDNLAVAIVGSRRCTFYGKGGGLPPGGDWPPPVYRSPDPWLDTRHMTAPGGEGRSIAFSAARGEVYLRQQGTDGADHSKTGVMSDFPWYPALPSISRRNRIISGLALRYVVVVEASQKSGADHRLLRRLDQIAKFCRQAISAAHSV